VKLKPGVIITGIRPEMTLGIMAAQQVYIDHGVEFVITSALDSTHSKTSLHYAGAAVDIRTRDMNKSTARLVCDTILNPLPNDFDCILESNHLHLEFQPRKPT